MDAGAAGGRTPLHATSFAIGLAGGFMRDPERPGGAAYVDSLFYVASDPPSSRISAAINQPAAGPTDRMLAHFLRRCSRTPCRGRKRRPGTRTTLDIQGEEVGQTNKRKGEIAGSSQPSVAKTAAGAAGGGLVRVSRGIWPSAKGEAVRRPKFWQSTQESCILRTIPSPPPGICAGSTLSCPSPNWIVVPNLWGTAACSRRSSRALAGGIDGALMRRLLCSARRP